MADQKIKWIYLRYIYPSVSAFISFLLLFVPCYRFISEGTKNDPISVFDLSKNTWDWGTRCLWGSGIEQSVGNVYFSKSAIAMVAVFYLLFVLGVAVSVYLTVSAILYMKKIPCSDKNRVILVTFFFNRIVVSLLQALTLPIFVFPRLLPSLYMNALNTYIEFRIEAIEPLVLVVALNVIGAVISIITLKKEKALSMNIFDKEFSK